MKHPYTVTEDRIEGTVFQNKAIWLQTLFYELAGFFFDGMAILCMTGRNDLPAWGKGVGAGMLLLGLIYHLGPLWDRRWFIMDQRGVCYRSLCRNWFLPWEDVRRVDLLFSRGAYRRTKVGFLCFTAGDRFDMAIDRYLKFRFNKTCFGIQYRPELVEFVQRHAGNAGLSDHWAKVVREEARQALSDNRGRQT